MNDMGAVNGQVVDNATSTATLISGLTPAHAFAILDVVMVETLGMAMYNAVNRQQNAGMASSAAVTAACARMLGAVPPITPPPPPPEVQPPVVNPLPGPANPPSSDAAVKAAFSQGQDAISTLHDVAGSTGSVANEALADLQALALQASSPSETSISSASPAAQPAASATQPAAPATQPTAPATQPTAPAGQQS
jgi:hypothetical protein